MSKTAKITDIDVRGRSRKHMGNIAALAESIKHLGLLHPVVITPESKLVVGRRRIEAYKHLGHDEIPVLVAHDFDDACRLIEAERDENTCREPCTLEETVHLGQRLEEIVRQEVRTAQREGQKRGGGDRRSEKAKRSRKSFPKAKQDETKRTRARAAVGISGFTYEKAKTVVESQDRKLIDEMNRTGKVNGVYKKLAVKKKAAEIEKEPPPLPRGPFRIIVCDPPWQYTGRAGDSTHRAASPYPTMTVEEICNLPVPSRAHDDCILWLWTTNAHLCLAFEVIAAWGFEYKTMLTWDKSKMGMGDWLRGQTEHCMLAVRGKPTIRLTNQTTLLRANAGKHSAKPDEFFHLVEELCPGSKLEMFQRTPRKGWTGHGDECEAS